MLRPGGWGGGARRRDAPIDELKLAAREAGAHHRDVSVCGRGSSSPRTANASTPSGRDRAQGTGGRRSKRCRWSRSCRRPTALTHPPACRWPIRSAATFRSSNRARPPAARWRRGSEGSTVDALGAAVTLEADVAYIDPPHNQHAYLGNYHIWEMLVVDSRVSASRARGSQMFASGAACSTPAVLRRKQVRWCSNASASVVVLSFNDEGFRRRPGGHAR